jgi:hypothetical protein
MDHHSTDYRSLRYETRGDITVPVFFGTIISFILPTAFLVIESKTVTHFHYNKCSATALFSGDLDARNFIMFAVGALLVSPFINLSILRLFPSVRIGWRRWSGARSVNPKLSIWTRIVTGYVAAIGLIPLTVGGFLDAMEQYCINYSGIYIQVHPFSDLRRYPWGAVDTLSIKCFLYDARGDWTVVPNIILSNGAQLDLPVVASGQDMGVYYKIGRILHRTNVKFDLSSVDRSCPRGPISALEGMG